MHDRRSQVDDGNPQAAHHADGTPTKAELAGELARHRRRLAAAAGMLQQAARLAQYHQPTLEREIRAFLVEMEP